MNVESAVRLINQLVYKPDWKITAQYHTNRFEGTVKVRIEYPAHASDRPDAEEGYKREITAYTEYPMIVQDCDDESVYYRILCAIIDIETHEAREFLRILPTYWAPFHPHQVAGMRRWAARTGGKADDDLRFGIA